MTIYTSVEAARTALREHDEERKRALAECREIAERAAAGHERESDVRDYQDANDRYDEHSNAMHEANDYIEARRQDHEDASAWEQAGKRLGSRTHTMSRTPESEVRYGRAFGEGQNFTDFVQPEKRKSLADAGRYIRAMVLDDVQTRATLVEGTDTLGGHLVPVEVLSPLLDLARNKTVLKQAGATFVPLSSMTSKMPTHTVDPVMAARSEGDALAAADTTLGAITFVPRSYAALIRVSEELIEDSGTDVDMYLANVIAAAAAGTIDQQSLYGSGVAPIVKGVKNFTGITITHMTGNDGGDLVNFDPVVDLVARLRTANYEPTAMITSPGLKATMAKWRTNTGGAGTGQYLETPEYLRGIPLLDTASVPTDLTVGGSGAVCTDILAADWRYVAVGMRQELRIRRLPELYAGTGEVGFAATMRFDMQVLRTGAVQILDGLKN